MILRIVMHLFSIYHFLVGRMVTYVIGREVLPWSTCRGHINLKGILAHTKEYEGILPLFSSKNPSGQLYIIRPLWQCGLASDCNASGIARYPL